VSKLVRVLRWVLAILAAAVAFILGFALVAVVWQHFGGARAGDAGTSYMWAVALGTMAGASVGSFIAPPDQRKLSSRVFVGAVVATSAILLIVSLVDHTFKVTNAFDVMGSLLGGGISLRLFHRLAGIATPASSQT
jgi:hypothetical protein